VTLNSNVRVVEVVVELQYRICALGGRKRSKLKEEFGNSRVGYSKVFTR
jgi:hypothetical protein